MNLRAAFADLIDAKPPQPVRIETEPHRRSDAGSAARRAEVLAMLEAEPNLRRAVKFYPDVPGPDVLCVVALRDFGTAELRIPRERYADGWAIFKALVDLGEQ